MTDTPAAHLDDAAAEMAPGARDGTSTTEAFENAVRGAWEAATRPWLAEAGFAGLRAEVQMVAQLDSSAVEAWLLRLGQVAHPSSVASRQTSMSYATINDCQLYYEAATGRIGSPVIECPLRHRSFL